MVARNVTNAFELQYIQDKDYRTDDHTQIADIDLSGTKDERSYTVWDPWSEAYIPAWDDDNPLTQVYYRSGAVGAKCIQPHQPYDGYMNFIWFHNTDYWEHISLWADGAGFRPIGTFVSPSSNYFLGSYNGRNHAITDLYINRPTGEQVALFGYVGNSTSSCVLKNIRLVNPDVTGHSRVAALLARGAGGKTEGLDVVENCHVINASISGIALTALLIGNAANPAPYTKVYNCSATGTVTLRSASTNRFNGLIVAGSHASFEKCWGKGSVVIEASGGGTVEFGGMGGRSNGGTFVDCFVIIDSLTGTANDLGGFVGWMNDSVGTPSFTRCYAVSPITDAGGFIKNFNGKTFPIVGCFFEGTINSGAALAKTEEQMKDKDTFTAADWDFETLWNIDETETINDGYPYLDKRSLPGIGRFSENSVFGDGFEANSIMADDDNSIF